MAMFNSYVKLPEGTSRYSKILQMFSLDNLDFDIAESGATDFFLPAWQGGGLGHPGFSLKGMKYAQSLNGIYTV